ncbi:L-dopachrome tautomerase-related protein [Nguyenibacter vanlangensis]|uniref:L-dopachrome tautomerase-related protein n=1 Tax=Nguyenibacter vanlangensis TaxID=1216886 RepID=A0ABZ3CZQ9_9PROT
MAHARSLRIEASNSVLNWNAVALAAHHVFVGGPRWTGFSGPSVAVLTTGGLLRPFPDSIWNGWKPGLDAKRRFVSVNALHIDPEGKLWVVDTGTPLFGRPPVKDGPKLVRLDPATGDILRVYPLDPVMAPPGSYIDDIRFNGPHAYLTDAGKGAVLVLDIATGVCRRVLDGAPATQARPDRPIVIDGRIVRNGNGTPLLINADPLEVSPDRKYLYFGPLEGPWSKVPTALLDDPATPPAVLAASVTPWADLPPIGGSAMDERGNLYFVALKNETVYRRDPAGRIVSLASDHRLHWADAPFLTRDGRLWLPVAQLDRLAQFQHGISRVQFPFLLLSLSTQP